jgi:hypothetical protein
MAYLNVIALERAEAKIEAVRGTPEAAMTHKLLLLAASSSLTLEQEHEMEPEMTASYQPYSDTQLKEQRCKLSVSFIANYEDMVWWFNHVVKGAALTGVTTGSTPPGYTYTINPTHNADDIATSTWKVGDGAVAYLLSRCVVNTLTISCNPQAGGDGTWRVTAELFCIFGGTTTFTSPADLTWTKIVSYGSKIYIDAIGGTIGTTELTNRWRSWSLTITLNIEEKSFGTLTAHTDFGRGYYEVTFEITMEHTDDVYFAAARANTPYKIRFEKTGAQIGTTPTTSYLIQLDLARAKLRIPTFSRAGQNKVAVFGGFGEKPSGGVSLGTKVVTAAASVAA